MHHADFHGISMDFNGFQCMLHGYRMDFNGFQWMCAWIFEKKKVKTKLKPPDFWEKSEKTKLKPPDFWKKMKNETKTS